MGKKTPLEAQNILNHKYAYLNNTAIHVLYKENPVASFSADQIQLERDVKEVVDHAYIIGRTPHFPSRVIQQINALIGIRNYNFYTTIRYDKKPVTDFIEEMKETYERPAKDALFTFDQGKVTSFKAHENGLQLRTEDFLINFHNAVESAGQQKSTITLKMGDAVLEPEITLAKANNLGIEELIGEGKSDYTHSIETRKYNVKLAASKFHGVLVPKGEEFSFNKYIGDISAESGYQPAYVIKNGRTVLGDGGGVCQVSTTMFRAALNTGLPITERNAHAYRVQYYENDAKPGFDATIFTPTVDFKFKNDTQAAILIQTELDEENNILRFKFYGKKDNRKIEISDATVWDIVPPPEPKYEDDPNLPIGTIKQVDFPARGTKSKFTYKVTHADGQMYEKEFYSSYRPWQAVFLRGTKT
ncbi:hypothetical protein BH09PAT2_BH09PAT2_09090 [soil metagenome]